MATALDLITRAYRKGRILGADQVLSAARGAAGLDELNDLLDEWWITKLMVFHILVEQFALIANQQAYTMGVGGNFNTTRPVKVVPGTKFTLSSVDRQLTVLTDRKSWDEIPYKSLVGPPQGIFVDEAYPLATIYFYPIPDQAYTVYINSWARLQSIAALNTTIALPPGYNRLIVNGLAIALCPNAGLEAPPSVVRAFGSAKRALELVNYELPVLSMPAAVQPRWTAGSSIITDG
jgi:hypothetical protein